MSPAAADAEDLVLVEANEEQRKHVRRLIYQDYEIWRRHRTIEQFWQADAVITDANLAHRRTWVLVPGKDAARSLDIRSAALTYRHEVLFSPPATQQQKTRRVNRATAYSVGGVFTPTQHPGRGYAGKAMASIHPLLQEFANATDDKGSKLPLACSVLWSDLGPYYERFGWKNKPFSDTWFPSKSSEQSPLPLEDLVRPVSDEQASDIFSVLAEEDVGLLTAELRLSTSTQTVMSLLEPNGDSWKHHWLQSRLQAQFQSRPVPASWGVLLLPQPQDHHHHHHRSAACSERALIDEARISSSWAVWFYDFRPTCDRPDAPQSKLIVLRHRAESPSALIALINAARRAAAHEGVETVAFWNLDLNSSPSSSAWTASVTTSELAEARSRGQVGDFWVEQRSHSRPAVAWYLDGSLDTAANLEDAAAMLSRGEEVEWLNAERGWCLMT